MSQQMTPNLIEEIPEKHSIEDGRGKAESEAEAERH